MADEQKIFLIELETGVYIRDWVEHAIYCDSVVIDCDSTAVSCAGLSGVFSRTLDPDEVQIIGVRENGIAMTEVASAAICNDTQGSFHFDTTTRALRVHATSDINDFETLTFVAIVLEALAYGASPIKVRGSLHIHYDGRVNAIPAIEQQISIDDFGGGAVASYGALVVANMDGRYDEMVCKRAFIGHEVRIYRGARDAAYSTFVLHMRAVMEEPSASDATLTVPLVSLARRLDAALLTDLFTLEAYPTIDPRIVGVTIPRVWGTAKGAHAFRIASGRWKVASHAMTSIDRVVKSDGVELAITLTDLLSGEFEVATVNDVEDRLFVDCRGYDLNYAGEMMYDVLIKGGIEAAKIDQDALLKADTRRAVRVGFQALGGTISDAVTLIAQSAFFNWRVTRDDIFSVIVKRRDIGNLVHNGDFITDVANWSVANSATIERSTTLLFRGPTATITKQAAGALGYAAAGGLLFEPGKMYTATLMVVLVSGTSSAFRIAITDSAGNERLSDPFTLSSEWQRITVTFPGLDGDVVLCDDEETFTNNNVLTCDIEGGQLRIYPQYNGGDTVAIAIDDVEVVETIELTDDIATHQNHGPHGPVIWRLRVPYSYDGRLGSSLFLEESDNAPRRLYPTSESRAPSVTGKTLTGIEPLMSQAVEGSANGVLVDEESAQTVLDAIFDFFSAASMRSEDIVHDVETVIEVGDVITLNTRRRPTLPGGGQLFRVVRVSESYPGGQAPTYAIASEAIFDPIYKIEEVTPT